MVWSAWGPRWRSLCCKVGLRPLGCEGGAQSLHAPPRAFSAGSRPVGGSGDVVPSVHEVLREARFADHKRGFLNVDLTVFGVLSLILRKKEALWAPLLFISFFASAMNTCITFDQPGRRMFVCINLMCSACDQESKTNGRTEQHPDTS